MSGLGTGAVPPEQPHDHVRGNGPDVTLYLDLACPACAATWARIRALPLRLCVRHFPVASRRPRSPALHAAAEAAGGQAGEEAFWTMWDSLYEDRGRTDDPHLWARAERLGLDLARFEADRRSDAVNARVQRDFRSGIRAGVVGTPAAFRGGQLIPGEPTAALAALANG